jgi:hypothetical protein
VTEVHCSSSDPAATLSPSAHETLAPATLSDARPSWTPSNDNVVPRISASAPSPFNVTEQDEPEQLTLLEVKVHPVSAARARPPASSPAARRDVDVVDMP